jgi:hypothetical protein
MQRKLVMAFAITSLSACSHTYKPEQISFINKPLRNQANFHSCTHFNEENCTPINQNELNRSISSTERTQLPKRTFLKTKQATASARIIPPRTTVKVAEQQTISSPRTQANLIEPDKGSIQNREIKVVAEFSATVRPPDTVDSNSPTIFNTPPLNTSGSGKICLGTTKSIKDRLALHPNWDSLKKIEINKDIFKHLVISESLAEDIAALNEILFDDGEVETRDNSRSSATDERNNDPNQTSNIRFRAIKLHENYKNYRSLIQEIAEQTQVEPALLHAIIQAESSYNPHARSPRGAVGLMQLMPATGRRFGVRNLTDPIANVYAGALYLRHLLEIFDNNKKLAIAGYNAGEYAVKRHGNKIPPYRQTQQYVNKVMSLYEAHLDKM